MKLKFKDILGLRLFKSFEKEPHKLASLIQNSSVLSFSRNQTILNEKEEDGGALYVIVRGGVKVAKIVNPNTSYSKVLAVLGQGDWFGEMSLFDRTPRSAAVITTEDSLVLRITREDFEAIVNQDPSLASSLLSCIISELSSRLRKTNTELVVLYDTGKIISRNLPLQELVFGLTSRLHSALSASDSAFLLFNELSNSYEQLYFSSENFISSPEKIMDILAGEESGICLENSSPLVQARFLLLAPVLIRGKLQGAFVFSRLETPFLDGELNLVLGVCNQAASEIENTRNREEEALKTAWMKRRGRR